jgi:diguanylate cyclase (GGDEF)-like protein
MHPAVPDEEARLAALASLHVIDGGPEIAFDRIARLGKASLGFPLAHITLVARDCVVRKTSGAPLPKSSEGDAMFCGMAIRSSQPLVIPDTLLDPRVADFPAVKGTPHIRSYWGAPLTTRNGYNLGTFCVFDYVPRQASASELVILRDLARLTIEFMEVRAQATTDVLTGVQSRRAFLAEGERLFASRHFDPETLSCIVLDIDHFKRVNDTLGHAKGDEVLRAFGKMLRGELRGDTPIGRIGGEEFAVLLPGEHLAGAYAVAERLRIRAPQIGVEGVQLTASFGVAERSVADQSLADLIERADQQAYQAKRDGRDCIRPDLATLH